MPVIVPRWEWRTFGSRFGTAEAGSAPDVGRIQESDEIYLLGGSGDNVKIRDDSWTSRSCARSMPTASSAGSR